MNWEFWEYCLMSSVKQLGDINDEIKRMGKLDGGVRLDIIKNFVELQKATIKNVEEALEHLYELDNERYDADGYDCNGYDREGYNRDGYNCDGYDRCGCSRDGKVS